VADEVTLSHSGLLCQAAAECAAAELRSSDVEVTDLSTMTTTVGGPAPASRGSATRSVAPEGCEDKRYYYNVVGARSVRPATIGTSYPIDGDTAWMRFDQDSSAKYTARFAGAALVGSFSGTYDEEGSKSFESGFGFTWDKSGRSRSYQVDVRYERLDRWFECMRDDWSWWHPVGLVGTTGDDILSGARPSFKHCSRQRSVGDWDRYYANGKAYASSVGVKFKGVIGRDLSSERAYNRKAILTYRITRRGRYLCGNNADPAYAGKIGEYWHQQ
jgi:hypothetical protein